MAKIPGIRIEDGFDKPFDGSSIGSHESEDRKPEPIAEIRGTRDIPTISPFDFDAERTAPDSGSRKRGRPFGSKNRVRAEVETESHLAANLDGLLLSAHFAVSKFLEVPELEINGTQAKQYADSLKEVMRHYQTNLDPKKLAWAQLILTMGGIYGPMIPAIRERKQASPKPAVVKPTPTPIDRGNAPRPAQRPLSEMSPSELNPMPPGETMESF